MLQTGIFLMESTFSGLFLWLGLYVITRDKIGRNPDPRRWWHRPALSAGLALICVACYLFGYAMQVISANPTTAIRWLRITYWALPLSIPTIFWATTLLVTSGDIPQRIHATYRVTFWVFLFAAIGISVASTMTDRFYRFEDVPTTSLWPKYQEVPPRYPAYALFIALILGGLIATIGVIAQNYRAVQGFARGQLRSMVAALAFLGLGVTVGFVTITYTSLLGPV
jgi:hypothetical protein